jgi:hypothetical protein
MHFFVHFVKIMIDLCLKYAIINIYILIIINCIRGELNEYS